MIQTKKIDKKYGYHISEIPKGKLGYSSKILEEILELIDAEKQGCRIMVMIELSDLVGAIKAYLSHNTKDTTLEDLETMANITKRAFESGHRK